MTVRKRGGNITGLSNALHEDLPCGLRLFKESLPEATRVAILTPEASNHHGVGPGVKSVEDVAHLFDMIPRVYSASTADELRAAIALMDRRTDVLVVIPDHRFAMNRSVILWGAHGGKAADLLTREGPREITAVAIIETSHLVVHSWFKDDHDVYSCAPFPEDEVLSFAREVFRLTHYRHRLIDRDNL